MRLFLFANAIGILSLGVEGFHLPTPQALWINEALRKVYPSSGRQIREGRIPNRLALVLEQDGQSQVLAEERFEKGFEYAFVVPGMTRVIQAAGRLIRSATDRGVIALLDRRFLDLPYVEYLPADWIPEDGPRALAGNPAEVTKRFFGAGL